MKRATAIFENGSKYASVRDVWQYDYGQILRIQGLQLPSMVEIHFSLTETDGTAPGCVGVTKNGITEVEIPNDMLENGGITTNYPIYAFIYLTDATSGETIYKIKIHVKARPRPAVYANPGANPDIFHEAVRTVSEMATNARASELVAIQKAKESEGFAHGHLDIPERRLDNAQYYMEAAKQVATKNGFAHLEIEEDGNLYLTRTENIVNSVDFVLNPKGELEAILK